MAAQVTVLDLTRRHNLKVTPGTYLSEVRDQACHKSGKKHTNFDLKSNAKVIDLSQTWRQSGLTPGAKLELVESSKSPSSVSVALQLPPSIPGGRLMDKSEVTQHFGSFLRRFEKTNGLNITQRGVASIGNGASGSGRIIYEMPALNITGRNLSTLGDLQKTLAQLGFNGGSVLMKLDFRKTDQPLEEAMAEIGQFFKEQEAYLSPEDSVRSEPSKSDTTVLNYVTGEVDVGEKLLQEQQTPSEDIHHSITPSKRSPPSPAEDVVLGPNQRPIAVFSAPSSNAPQASLQAHNEADYEPSLAHLKLHEARMQSKAQNKRLLSDDEEQRLEEQKSAKLISIKEVKIKIRFPDQMTLVTTHTADDSAAELYQNVRGMIIAEDQPFKLVYTSRGPPQSVPDDASKKLIRHLGFEGSMLVNFHWEDVANASARKPPVLKPHLAQMAKEPVAAQVLEMHEDDKEEAAHSHIKGKVKETSEKIKGAMPKWFKGVGKK